MKVPHGQRPLWSHGEKIIWEKDAPTWEEVLGNSLHKDTEKEDSDWDEDTHVSVESQFEDAAMATETCMDTVEESTVEALPSENIVEAEDNIVEGISRPGKPGRGSDPCGE